MQAQSRRLGQQSLNSAASISSLGSTYSISDVFEFSSSHLESTFFPLCVHLYTNRHRIRFHLRGCGLDYPRYGSTLASRGSGYVVRKGTGGRSSVSLCGPA
ncbi:hypothetical protein AKJ16_DCAP22200 [Drosera capensis]